MAARFRVVLGSMLGVALLTLVACASGSPAMTPPPLPSSSVQPTATIAPPPTTKTPPPPSSARPPTTAAPPTSLPPSLAGACWSGLPIGSNVVALTFDAGGNDAGVASIVATLRREGVPATFFVTGRWAEVYPDAARAIASDFPIGNHGQTHTDLTALSQAAVTDEVLAGQRSLLRITGHDPRPFFRFPYGRSSAEAIATIHVLGYGCIGWTIGSPGWQGKSSGVSVDSIVRRVEEGLRPGAILLMHVGANPKDGSKLDADALPRVIRTIRAHGYGFVTVADSV